MDKKSHPASRPAGATAVAGTPNPDALLEQLAAAEIDRILEEAGAGDAAGARESDAATAMPQTTDADGAESDVADASRKAAEAAIAEELDGLYAALNAIDSPTAPQPATRPPPEPPLPPPASTTTAPGQAAGTVAPSAAVDAPVRPAAAPRGEMAGASRSDSEVAAIGEMPPAAQQPAPPNGGQIDPDEQTGRLEKTALTDDAPVGGPDEGLEGASSAGSGVPLYVRLLELVNLPVSGLSAGARAVMGKVAIGTLINALVLLGYLALTRRL